MMITYRTVSCLLSVFVIALVLGVSASFGQGEVTSPDRGMTGNGSYSVSDIETIDLQSGNVMFNVPLGKLALGRGGMSAGINLSYNSKIWDMETYDDPPENTIVETLKQGESGGWRYGYKYELKDESYCHSGNVNKYSIVMPDGSKHLLVAPGATDEEGYVSDVADGAGTCVAIPPFVTSTTNVTYSTMDGSFLRLEIISNGTGNFADNSWVLFLPDGGLVVHKPQGVYGNQPDVAGVEQRIIDRNGNYIDYLEKTTDADYDNHRTTTVRDQLGRKLVIEYEAATNQDWIRSKGVGGAEIITRVQWTTVTVRKAYRYCIVGSRCNQGNMHQPLVQPFTVVDKVFLPAQLGDPQNAGDLFYDFDYNADQTSNPTVGWGEVSGVTTPSGAKAAYTYKKDNVTGASNIRAHGVLANRPIQKTLTYDLQYDGVTTPTTETWNYEVFYYFNDERTQEVERTVTTAPNGAVTTQHFGAWYGSATTLPAYASKRQLTKSESPDGSTVERIYSANVPADPAIMYAANSFVKYEFTSITDASGNKVKTAIKEYSQDKNGNVTEVKEYDFVPYASVPRDSNGRPTGLPSNASSYLKRITKNDYYNDVPDSASTTYSDADSYYLALNPRLLNLVKSTEIQNAAGTPQTRSEIAYDFTNYSTNTKGGNATETKLWDNYKGGINQAYSNPLTSNNSISSTVQYDGYGNPTIATDAKGSQTQINYGTMNGYTGLYPTQIVSVYGTAIARTSTTAYDFYTGLLTSYTDVDNNLTSATVYDDLGRAIKVARAVNCAHEIWTQTIYDDIDRKVIVKSDIEVKGDAKKVGTRFYDQLGRVRLSKTLENATTQSATNETDGIKVQTRYKTTNGYTYQLTSNPYRANYPANAGGEATMGWTQSKAINTGRHSETETFSGATLPTAFGGNNANSTGIVTTDLDADRTLVTDQAGKRRISKMNALGQLENVWEITAADSNTEAITFGSLSLNGYKTGYVYDPLNNLTTVNQGGQQRSFAYTSLSRLKTATNPESGAISYQYDNNGNLTKKIDARLVETSYSYDALNRVLMRSYANEPAGQNPTPAVAYYYDGVYFNAANQQQTAIGAVKGKLTSVSSSVSRTNYSEFDQVGRVLKSQQITDGAAYPEMTFSYNLSGALVEQKYPSGRVVKNVLDNEGDLSIVQSKKNQVAGFWNYADNFTYNALGAVTSMQLGNGRWESTAFNSRLQPVQIALGTVQNGTDKLKLNFTYNTTTNGNPNADNNGNVLSQTITVPTEVRNATTYNGFTATQSYSYDSLNRIKQATETVSGQSGNNWQQTFDYDRFGNRTFNEANTTASANFPKACNGAMCVPDKKIFNPQAQIADNRFSTSDGYQYDSAGNTTRDAQSRKFTYDAENKQTKVETVDSNGTVIGTLGEYFYDGDGKRVKKYVPSTGETTVFIYDAFGKLIAENSTLPAPTQTVSYLTSDHLGSPRINADQNGNVTARHDYQPFGEEIQRASYGTDANRNRFTSYERDNEISLDFAQARYHNYSLGRFSSPDSFLGSAYLALPQSLNRYVYCLNNPINLIDPSGLIWLTDGNGNYHWVADDEYDPDDEKWKGYSVVENGGTALLPSDANLWGNLNTFYNYSLRGGYVKFNADGTLSPGENPNADVEEDSSSSLNDFLWKPIVEGEGAAGEQMIGQDYLPDSVEFSGGYLGLGGTGKLTRNGDVLVGPNANVADSIANPLQAISAMRGRVLPSGSLMLNKTLRFGRIARPDRLNIESGTSFGIGGGSIIGGQILYIPSTGDVVIGGGLTTPGVYFGGSYLKPIDTVPFNW